MARRTSAKVVINRQAVDAIRLGWADGTQEVGQQIVDATAPRLGDAPPYGKGLRESGAAVTYVDGKKVAGRGSAPREARPRVLGTVFGFGFPGRFYTLGTVDQPPRPVFVQEIAGTVGGATEVVAKRITERLARTRNR